MARYERRLVVVERRGCLWWFGTFILAGMGATFALAWPEVFLYGTVAAVAEGLWLALLFAVAALAFIGYALERGRADRDSAAHKSASSQPQPGSETGPRDWLPAEDDGRRK